MKYHLTSKATKTLQQLWKKRPKKIQNENSWVRIVSGLFKIVVFKVTFMRHPSLSKGKGSVQSFVLFRSSFPVNHKPTWGKKKKKSHLFSHFKKVAFMLCNCWTDQLSSIKRIPTGYPLLPCIFCLNCSFGNVQTLQCSLGESHSSSRACLLPATNKCPVMFTELHLLQHTKPAHIYLGFFWKKDLQLRVTCVFINLLVLFSP